MGIVVWRNGFDADACAQALVDEGIDADAQVEYLAHRKGQRGWDQGTVPLTNLNMIEAVPASLGLDVGPFYTAILTYGGSRLARSPFKRYTLGLGSLQTASTEALLSMAESLRSAPGNADIKIDDLLVCWLEYQYFLSRVPFRRSPPPIPAHVRARSMGWNVEMPERPASDIFSSVLMNREDPIEALCPRSGAGGFSAVIVEDEREIYLINDGREGFWQGRAQDSDAQVYTTEKSLAARLCGNELDWFAEGGSDHSRLTYHFSSDD